MNIKKIREARPPLPPSPKLHLLKANKKMRFYPSTFYDLDVSDGRLTQSNEACIHTCVRPRSSGNITR